MQILTRVTVTSDRLRGIALPGLWAAMLLVSPVQAADMAAAEQQAQTLCAACHGPQGISSNPLWPNLAGQQEAYLAKSIKDYQSGARNDPSMSPIAQMLSEQDIANLAAYFSAK